MGCAFGKPANTTSVTNLRRNADLCALACEGNTERLSDMIRGMQEESTSLHSRLDVDVVNEITSMTPLMFACQAGKLDCARLLIDHGANIDYQDWRSGKTSLILAAEGGHSSCMNLLLKKNVNVTLQCNDGMTALHGAVMHDQLVCVQLLLGHDERRMNNNNNNNNNNNVNNDDDKKKNKKKKRDNYNGDAKSNDNDTNDNDTNDNNDVDGTSYNKLINIQADNGMTACHLAVRGGYARILSLLLEAGADINIRNIDNKTPLGVAIENKEKLRGDAFQCMVDLLQKHNDKDTKVIYKPSSSSSSSSLSSSSSSSSSRTSGERDGVGNRVDALQSLSSSSSSPACFIVNHNNNNLNTSTTIRTEEHALFHHVALGNVDILRQLISAEPSCVNYRDNKGNTPLLWACANSRADVVDVLLSHGANPLLVGSEGILPIDCITFIDGSKSYYRMRDSLVKYTRKYYTKTKT